MHMLFMGIIHTISGTVESIVVSMERTHMSHIAAMPWKPIVWIAMEYAKQCTEVCR